MPNLIELKVSDVASPSSYTPLHEMFDLIARNNNQIVYDDPENLNNLFNELSKGLYEALSSWTPDLYVCEQTGKSSDFLKADLREYFNTLVCKVMGNSSGSVALPPLKVQVAPHFSYHPLYKVFNLISVSLDQISSLSSQEQKSILDEQVKQFSEVLSSWVVSSDLVKETGKSPDIIKTETKKYLELVVNRILS